MTAIGRVRAGVVGTGFIGVVHVDALRRLGVEVVDVVHVTTPNHLHYPGHVENVLCDAIARSHAERAWVQVPTTEVIG